MAALQLQHYALSLLLEQKFEPKFAPNVWSYFHFVCWSLQLNQLFWFCTGFFEIMGLLQFPIAHHSGTSWLHQKLRQIIKSSHKTCFLVSVHISLKLFAFSAFLWRSCSLCDTPESRWNWHEHNYHNKQGPTIIIKSNKYKSELSITIISSKDRRPLSSNLIKYHRRWR